MIGESREPWSLMGTALNGFNPGAESAERVLWQFRRGWFMMTKVSLLSLSFRLLIIGSVLRSTLVQLDVSALINRCLPTENTALHRLLIQCSAWLATRNQVAESGCARSSRLS